MLGSMNEADDAVQEAWLRLSRSDANSIENLGGWLTTVVSHVCLDMLRSRASRKEEALDSQAHEPVALRGKAPDPEQETLMADSVGVALMIVLDRLAPAERLAFVLHDMFAAPFAEIASILGRSPDATRQLASRARRRVQGAPAVPTSSLSEQRRVADAFLAALRAGDFEGLIAVLDPEVVVHIDEVAAAPGPARAICGARNWAKGAIAFSRQLTGLMQPMLVNGAVGLVWAREGQPSRVLRYDLRNGKIVAIEIIADPARVQQLDLAVLPPAS
jgi:RNA polymerase sigma factor (sigma-70 family)